ncbi:MAG: leader peptide processing enzyme [Spirochaetaceae bacterium]|jgi:hypothetical protein|nr:leader peptide processing enzyme [Spirochaetaceae bacterium]
MLNKRASMILFMIAATAFNIIATVLCFIVLLLFYMVLLIPHIPAEAAFMGLPVLFAAAVIASCVAYRWILTRYLRTHPHGMGGTPEKPGTPV